MATVKCKYNRIGEKRINNFGSEMIIIEYRKAHDVDVYFPQYDWIARNKQYYNFKKGEIKCPYEKRYYNVGYIGEGKYKIHDENGKKTKCYYTWNDILRRCYSEKFHKKRTTYMGCKVCKEWLNFQNFADWYYKNYYTVEGQRMDLDKDILVKHNKIYSPDTCIYVPQTINTLFVKCNKSRGESVIGVSYYKRDNVYLSRCNMINPETGKSKIKYLGSYKTEHEAFEVYKYYKEKNIKMVADYFKKYIPYKLYKVLYRYEVEITD